MEKRALLLMAALCAACGKPPAPPAPVMPAEQTATLTMASFTVPPGGEATKCQWFTNPTGADLEVHEFESHMSKGAHHLLLTTELTPKDAPLADCEGGAGGDALVIYGSQQADYRRPLPAGVVVEAPNDKGLRLQIHYLNATTSPVDVSAEVVMHLAEPESITAHAGVLFFANQEFTVPATPESTTITKTCTMPIDLNVVTATSHMHRHGVEFFAFSEGTMVYDSDTWEEPATRSFDPPLALAAGNQITFSCTYKNDTGAEIAFGPSAATDEMCQLGMTVYPVPKLRSGSWACY
jgi:hypothetical protein